MDSAARVADGETEGHHGERAERQRQRRRAEHRDDEHGQQRAEYDREVARTWGWLSARGHQRGRPRPTNDMWIAACCLAAGLPLATLNVKDFADFAEYDGLRLIGHD
jgi:predicted nucleic acid-binding protein